MDDSGYAIELSPEDYSWSEANTVAFGDASLRQRMVEAGALLHARQRLSTTPPVPAPGLGVVSAPLTVAPRFPSVTTRLLAERGFWTLTPSAQLVLFEWDDLSGTLEMQPSPKYGAPGVVEALVLNVLISRWCAGPRDRAKPEIRMSAHEITRTLGMRNTGPNLARVVQAVECMVSTTYRYVEQSSTGGYSDSFHLLDRVKSHWKGPPTSPNRHLRATISEPVLEALANQRMIRRVDLATLQALGEQRELARRLFLFLESRPGHREKSHDRIEHLVDERLAHTLGTNAPLKHLCRLLRRAGKAIEDVNDRYRIELVPRTRAGLRPGDPRYLLRVQRKHVERIAN